MGSDGYFLVIVQLKVGSNMIFVVQTFSIESRPLTRLLASTTGRWWSNMTMQMMCFTLGGVSLASFLFIYFCCWIASDVG